MLARRKVFGAGHTVPLDRNAKCRIAAYARAWTARHRRARWVRQEHRRRVPQGVGVP